MVEVSTMTYKVKFSMCNVLAAFFSVRLRWAYKSGGLMFVCHIKDLAIR